MNPQGGASGSGGQIVGGGVGDGPGPGVIAATLKGTKVISADGEDVGKISNIMLDVRGGRVAYAVLSQCGLLGIGTNVHA